MPVFEELQKSKKARKYKFIWLVEDKTNPLLPKYDNVKYVRKRRTATGAEYLHYIYRAKVLIFCNQIWHKLNLRTKSICLYHGVKNKRTRGTYDMPKNLDAFLMTSRIFEEVTKYEFDMSDKTKLLYLGYPRNDLLFKGKGQDFHKYIQTPADKLLVWYPTFRRAGDRADATCTSIPIIESKEQLLKLNETAKEQGVLIVIKFHFVDRNEICSNEYSNLLFIDDDFFKKKCVSSYEFLGMSDGLITDYSSVFYDYLLLDKPICLSWEDFDEYKHNFPFDPMEMYKGGEKVYGVDELCDFVKNIDKDRLQDERRAMNIRCNEITDGTSTQKVSDYICSLL